MTEPTTERKPRRTAKEIAQSHADKAAAAVEKHDEKLSKVDSKINKLERERVELEAKREELVREADYRQMHPLLRQEEADAEQPQAEAPSMNNPFD